MLLILTRTFMLLTLSELCPSMCYGSNSAPNFCPCTVNLNSNQKKLAGGSGEKKKSLRHLFNTNLQWYYCWMILSYVFLTQLAGKYQCSVLGRRSLFCQGSEMTVYVCFRHAVMRKMLRMMTWMMQVSSLAIPHSLVGRIKILYHLREYWACGNGVCADNNLATFINNNIKVSRKAEDVDKG